MAGMRFYGKPSRPQTGAHVSSKTNPHIIICALILCSAVLCHTEATDSDTCGAHQVAQRYQSDEARLFSCIMKDLNPAVRPVMNASHTVNVIVDPLVLKVMDMDEKSHVLTTNGWVYHEWHDFQLSWDPAQYGGLEHIRIPTKDIWTPDIVLFNNAEDKFEYVVDELAVVSYVGNVTWVPHARLRSYCTLELARFPFDSQTCALIFGSWTHDVTKLNVTTRNNSKSFSMLSWLRWTVDSTLGPVLHNRMPEGGMPQYMADSNEWTVTTAKSSRYQWRYKNMEQYAGIITKIELKRSSSFYQYVFIMPTVLIAFLSLLMPFINPNTNERLTYGIMLVIGCVLVLTILENHMPSEIGTVPVVAAYLAYLMVMISIQLFFSILVSNMYLKNPKRGKVPGWMRWIFLTKINKLVCVAVDPYSALPTEIAVEETNAERELLDMRMNNGTADPLGKDAKSSIERTMEDIRRYLRVCAMRAVTGSESGGNHQLLVQQEWCQVAKVIDRFIFMGFCVLTIVITISMYAHY